MSTVVSRSTVGVSATAGPRAQRAIFLLLMTAAVAAGFLVTHSDAAADAAGEDLTRLLRGMALIKAFMAALVIGGVAWRLGTPASRLRFTLYAATCGMMSLGPGLIWGMEHVRAGAVFLHVGLAISLVVLWLDPAVGARLSALVRSRRRERV